ncbi:MAG: hypothetical protein U9N84_07595 [Actinomycetota bacterium]|nr:hypothetical protein [Actinomycetota bacterium]
MRSFLVVLIIGVSFLFAACSEETRSEISEAVGDRPTTEAPAEDPPEAAPEPTEAPEPAPEPTEAPDDGVDSAETTSAILLLALIAIVIIVVIAITRGSKKAPAPVGAVAPPAVSPVVAAWGGRARTAYTNARWLQDNLVDDLAVWRGDSQLDPGSIDPDDRRSALWHQIDQRMSAAVTELYGLEADAPSSAARDSSREAVDALQSTREAFETRASARTSRLRAAADPTAEAAAVEAATNRELAAASDLEQRRGQLARSLDGLAEIFRSA